MTQTIGCARTVETFATKAAFIAMRSAAMYLKEHKLEADADNLCGILRTMMKDRVPEALLDAQQALALNMGQVADATFRASMAAIGIAAAREAGYTNRDDD